MKQKLKNITTDTAITAFYGPFLILVIVWFATFVMTSYTSFADVSNLKSDLAEIKTEIKGLDGMKKDVRDIHAILVKTPSNQE